MNVIIARLDYVVSYEEYACISSDTDVDCVEGSSAIITQPGSSIHFIEPASVGLNGEKIRLKVFR